MNKTLHKIFTITGAIMLFMFLTGALANAYGANITITQISNLVWIILLLVTVSMYLINLKK